jgi:NCAIR mutase (PurE)-related protein
VIRQPFHPDYGSGQSATLAAAGTQTFTVRQDARNVAITNQGANPVYVRIGDSGVAAATTADYPVPPNAQVVISKSNQFNTVKLLSPAGTTVHVMTGEGW